MKGKNITFIKLELKKHEVDFPDDISVSELKELFGRLPITAGQIKELKLFNIRYKSRWCWTRGFAARVIEESIKYAKLRDALPASPAQMIILMEHGRAFDENLTSGEAARLIYDLEPEPEQLEYIDRYKLKVSEYKKVTYGYAKELIDRRENYVLKSKFRKSGDDG